MGIFQSLIKKETLHIVRDPRTMTVTLLIPLLLLLLFGFAISMEVNDIRIAVVTDKHNDITREISEKLRVNNYFTFKGEATEAEVEQLLKTGEIDAAVCIRENGGTVQTQIITDASNPTTAKTMTAYIQGAIIRQPLNAVALTSVLYNPQMKSAYNFVPGILGMIFILICAIMTSVSIVREKETGTMDLLLVSPMRPMTIIFGKLIPYFGLSCIILTLMLLISYTVLGLPVSMSIVNVVLMSMLYIVLSLSIGLLVSTLVNTQLAALIVSAVIFMLPVVMLSGMIFSIENMPSWLQWISCVIPARWYIDGMRKLMIQQLDIVYVAKEVVILLAMTTVLLTLAIKNFTQKSK